MRKKRSLAKKVAGRTSTPWVHGGAGGVMASIQYSRNRENLGGVTPWSPWSPRPFEEKAFFAGNGQDIRRELWKTLHYCWKSSRKQFGNDLKPSLKSVLEENLQISCLTVRRPFFIIDEVGFCKIEVEGQATQGKQHPRNLI